MLILIFEHFQAIENSCKHKYSPYCVQDFETKAS